MKNKSWNKINWKKIKIRPIYIYIYIYTHHSLYTYIYIFFFYHTTCESTCDTLASSAANQGDNTVSVAQGGTATPGTTE